MFFGSKNVLLYSTGNTSATLSKLLYNGSSKIILGEGATKEEISKHELLTREYVQSQKTVEDLEKRLLQADAEIGKIRVGFQAAEKTHLKKINFLSSEVERLQHKIQEMDKIVNPVLQRMSKWFDPG